MGRDNNREQMPVTAAMIDDFRTVFGADQIAGFRARENGKTIVWGEVTSMEDGMRAVSPELDTRKQKTRRR